MIAKFIRRMRPDARPLMPRLYLPSVERDKYVAGWRWGVICGAVAASWVALIVRYVL